MNQNIKTSLGVVIIVIIVVTIGFFVWTAQKESVHPAEQVQKLQNPVVDQVKNNESQSLVGNDKDEHGCIGSAGYSWCEAKQKCLRSWEEKCENSGANSWKTYANEKYRFEIKIPQDWKVENESKIISNEETGMTNITFSTQNKSETFDTLNIMVIPTVKFEKCKNTPMCNIGAEIGENNGFTFGFLSGAVAGHDSEYYEKYMKEKLRDNDAVIATFKFVK
jgi:hypothetical protein